ncbi:acyltransferase [Geoglobus ahangari]|uniref:Acyltransferase n=1 Tax=Geoglobus ahangari TaxID=113653 RepID=A0A0F7IGT6_9EURY|nr:GNAT family N-acetyltransferase [Geoglobus ahangari]AKG91144.1 acyltransferase [Geoglobus ahangari]NOY12051.1 GNAT family N-acetyltransferase [Archaeoglobi archaeon]
MMSAESTVKREFPEFEPVTFTDRKGDRVVIRKYEHEKDREKLVHMYETFSPDNRCLGLPPSTRIAIEHWVDYLAERGFALVAEIDGRIVGHCSIVPTEDWKRVDLSIFVHQDFQDRGIGQALLRHMIEYARKAGFEGIMLVTERSNERALHVYRKLGFIVVNPEYEYDLYLPLK